MSSQQKAETAFAQSPTVHPDGYLTVTTDPFVKVTHDMVAEHGEGTAEAGFDLTDFGSLNTFSHLLRAHDLEPGSNHDARFDVVDQEPCDPDRTHVLFAWSNPSVALFTGNNPITGVYNAPGMRREEEGYASYMGISGREDRVSDLFDDIRDRADHVKGANRNARDYI